MRASDGQHLQTLYLEKPRVYRGLAELRPKSMDLLKSLVTLARQSPNLDKGTLHILATIPEFEAKRLQIYLSDILSLRMMTPHLPAIIQILRQFKDEKCDFWGFVGISLAQEEKAPEDLMLAQSICFNDSQIELRAADLILKRLKSPVKFDLNDSQSFIYEEKIGKFSLLDLEKSGQKVQIKRLQSLYNQENSRQPVFAEEGFSLFEIGLSRIHSEKHHLRVFFATNQIEFSGCLDLGFLLKIGEVTGRWMHDLEFMPATVRKICVSCPWLAIGTFVGERLSALFFETAELSFLDHCFGWNPIATFLQTFSELDHGANLHIYFGPKKIYLSLIWI